MGARGFRKGLSRLALGSRITASLARRDCRAIERGPSADAFRGDGRIGSLGLSTCNARTGFTKQRQTSPCNQQQMLDKACRVFHTCDSGKEYPHAQTDYHPTDGRYHRGTASRHAFAAAETTDSRIRKAQGSSGVGYGSRRVYYDGGRCGCACLPMGIAPRHSVLVGQGVTPRGLTRGPAGRCGRSREHLEHVVPAQIRNLDPATDLLYPIELRGRVRQGADPTDMVVARSFLIPHIALLAIKLKDVVPSLTLLRCQVLVHQATADRTSDDGAHLVLCVVRPLVVPPGIPLSGTTLYCGVSFAAREKSVDGRDLTIEHANPADCIATGHDCENRKSCKVEAYGRVAADLHNLRLAIANINLSRQDQSLGKISGEQQRRFQDCCPDYAGPGAGRDHRGERRSERRYGTLVLDPPKPDGLPTREFMDIVSAKSAIYRVADVARQPRLSKVADRIEANDRKNIPEYSCGQPP